MVTRKVETRNISNSRDANNGRESSYAMKRILIAVIPTPVFVLIPLLSECQKNGILSHCPPLHDKQMFMFLCPTKDSCVVVKRLAKKVTAREVFFTISKARLGSLRLKFRPFSANPSFL
jgi:hypothetical protein